ncbi:MAG: DUF4037 domain-containing protein [Candidatus Peregrinibacteria bacterium]
MPAFTNCLQLSQAFFSEIVAPILREEFPTLRYDAALIGTGSEVLGFDDEQSSDHDWRPRVYIFLAQKDADSLGEKIERCLREKLPQTFRGYPTMTKATDDPRTRFVHSLDAYVKGYLGIGITAELKPEQWLVLPEQKLLSLTSGQVFHDGLGQLRMLRERLAYYPRDVWLYIMASQWQRISQEEHFMGRAGSIGDDIGSRIIATRLVRDIMRLAFLQERQYAPYIKWFGTAFSRLASARELSPHLRSVLNAHDWKEREQHLSKAYEVVARKHNDLALTPSLDSNVSPFFDRPFLVIHAGEFASALQKLIEQPSLRRLPLIGSIDQILDNTDVQETASITGRMVGIYL